MRRYVSPLPFPFLSFSSLPPPPPPKRKPGRCEQHRVSKNNIQGKKDLLIRAFWRNLEREDGQEEHDQLPYHEAVSEDQGTDEAGQVKKDIKRGMGVQRDGEDMYAMYGDDPFSMNWGAEGAGAY